MSFVGGTVGPSQGPRLKGAREVAVVGVQRQLAGARNTAKGTCHGRRKDNRKRSMGMGKVNPGSPLSVWFGTFS